MTSTKKFITKQKVNSSVLCLSTTSLSPLQIIKEHVIEILKQNILGHPITQTKPGSIDYLLNGPTPSKQSINIKMGKCGEQIAIKMITLNPSLRLLKCGIQSVSKDKKKDIDLIWVCETTKTIYIREAKGNIQLDTEKLPATFKKITDDLKPFIQETYPDYNINVGILNWSVYNRNELTEGINQIKQCEKNGVKVDHWSEFCDLVGFIWPRDDYYDYFRKIGRMILDDQEKIDIDVADVNED